MKKILKAFSEDETSYTYNCTNKEACVIKFRQNITIRISVSENKGKS